MNLLKGKEEIVIEINSKNFVLGLIWETFYFETNSQKNRKLNTYKKSIKSPSGVVVDSKGICSLGLTTKKLKGKPISLAATLARTYKNSVHAHKLRNGIFWLCWIKNGVPVSGGERFFNDAKDIKAYILDEIIPLTGSMEFFGDRNLVPSIVEGVFSDHDLETTVISLNDRDRSSRIRDLYISTRVKLLTVGCIALLALVTSYYYINNADVRLMEQARLMLERQTNKIKHKFEKSRDKFFSEMDQYSSRETPGKWIKSIVSEIGEYPDYYKGWTLKKIVCSGGEATCKLFWNSTHNGTNANFVKRFIGQAITFHPGGKEALINVLIPERNEPALDAASFYENLPTKPVFYGQYLSKIQYLQASEVFRYQVGDKTDELNAPSNSTIVNGKAVKSNPMGVFIRGWKLKGTGLYHLIELSLELPQNSFVIDSLVINYDLKNGNTKLASWKMEGRYAHKK
jgi:hypothetical protein